MKVNNESIEFLNSNLKNAGLVSFGIKLQFIELEFNNEKFEKIMFFLDCNVSTSCVEVEELVSPFKKYDKDTFGIAYFIKSNSKEIINVSFDELGNFKVEFENNYDIIFDLTADDANLSITFRDKIGDKERIVVDMYLNDIDIHTISDLSLGF
jgi:hypothetical protein